MISKTKNIGITQGRETIITLFIAISFLVLMNGKIGAKEISDEGMKDYLSRYGHLFENLDRSSYIPSKKVYMEEKVESYKNDMIKQYGKVITEDDLKSKYINQLLDDYEKKEYNKDDAIENLRKLLDLSSICFFASDLNCVVPLRRLKNQFELSTLTYEIYFIGGISRRKGKSTEYPLIHLALQCGEKAVEPLRELILDDELSSKNRVWALGTLLKLMKKKRKSFLP